MKLGNVCSILNGFAFRSENYVHEGIRIIRISNVQKGYIEDKVPAFYPYNSEEAIKYKLECGDILISLTGNVGRVAILTAEFLPATLNQRVACLRIKNESKLDKSFLFNYLNSDRFEQQCIVSSKGVAQKNMSTEWLKEYEMPDLTIKQQKEISQILSELSTLILCGKRQLAKLDELVKSRFMEQFGSYLGDETRCATVEQVCTVFADGDWIESKDQADDGIRLIQTGNVGNGVYLDKGERARYIDEETFVRLNCTEVLPNDILISRLPDPVGRACIIPDGLGKSITAVDCSIVRLKSHVLPEFFVAYTMTTLYAAQIGSSVTGSTRKRISRKNLGQVVIPTPDIDQQEQFAAFVRQSDKSKLAVKQSLEKLETLKKSLMQQHFG